MNLTYFKVYKDFIDIARELDNGQRGRVFLALLQYVNGEKTEPLTGGEKIAFMMMKGQIDRDAASYDKTSEVRSEAGRKGAMARWGKNDIANATDAILPIANDGKNAKTKTKDKEEKTKTKKNIPPISPQGDRFDDFWKAYPKKTGKGAAKKAFDRIKPSAELLDRMLIAINQQQKSDQWKRDNGQYIPNPATWLNQQRWEDEVTENTGLNTNNVYLQIMQEEGMI